tara:strand:- start:446 stop:646 length:201 start_codon:yes stop_codon:yes gene_type:complete
LGKKHKYHPPVENLLFLKLAKIIGLKATLSIKGVRKGLNAPAGIRISECSTQASPGSKALFADQKP